MLKLRRTLSIIHPTNIMASFDLSHPSNSDLLPAFHPPPQLPPTKSEEKENNCIQKTK